MSFCKYQDLQTTDLVTPHSPLLCSCPASLLTLFRVRHPSTESLPSIIIINDLALVSFLVFAWQNSDPDWIPLCLLLTCNHHGWKKKYTLICLILNSWPQTSSELSVLPGSASTLTELIHSPRGPFHTLSSLLKPLYDPLLTLNWGPSLLFHWESRNSHCPSHRSACTLNPESTSLLLQGTRCPRCCQRAKPSALELLPSLTQGHCSRTSSSIFCVITFPLYWDILVSVQTCGNSAHRKNKSSLRYHHLLQHCRRCLRSHSWESLLTPLSHTHPTSNQSASSYDSTVKIQLSLTTSTTTIPVHTAINSLGLM